MSQASLESPVHGGVEVRVAVEPADERDDVLVRWELRDGTRALGFLQRGAAL